jgi:hypothetical protein
MLRGILKRNCRSILIHNVLHAGDKLLRCAPVCDIVANSFTESFLA